MTQSVDLPFLLSERIRGLVMLACGFKFYIRFSLEEMTGAFRMNNEDFVNH